MAGVTVGRMSNDSGLELMRLYRELRNASDPKHADAVRARIDAIVANARAASTPTIVGAAQASGGKKHAD